ncbi:17265_t:CDS:2, partial [Funneliformis geosporum]
VAVFNDGVKTNVLAGKMAGRFTSPNPFNNSIGNAVTTPALFIGHDWLKKVSMTGLCQVMQGLRSK